MISCGDLIKIFNVHNEFIYSYFSAFESLLRSFLKHFANEIACK